MKSVDETIEAANESIIYSQKLISRITKSVVGLKSEGILTTGECIKAASRGYAKLRDEGDITSEEFAEAVGNLSAFAAVDASAEPITQIPTKAEPRRKETDRETLFNEIIARVNVYIRSSDGAPQFIKDDFTAMGWKLNLTTLFGHDALQSAFCTSYPEQLKSDLRLLKTDTEEDAKRYAEVGKWVKSKCGIYSKEFAVARGHVKRIFNWDTVPGTGSDKLLRNLKSVYGLAWVKGAEISKSDDGNTITIRNGDKSAEITIYDETESAAILVDDDVIFLHVEVEKDNRILYKYKRNHLRYFGKIWTDMDALTTDMTQRQLRGELIPVAYFSRETAVKVRYKRMVNLRSRIKRYFRSFGLFLLYLEIKGIKISDVDADVFMAFQSAYKVRTGTTSEDTLNNLRRDLMIFLTKHLAPKGYLKAIPYEEEGSIPTRKYDVETTPEPPEVFTLKIDDKGRLTTWKPEDPESTEVADDVRSLYTWIRKNQYGHDPKLLEICLRMLRETGLRPQFAYRIQFGDITSKPVTHVGKIPIYHLRVGNLKKYQTPGKRVPHYDMYISGSLGEMIQKYKKAYEDNHGVTLQNRFMLFNGVMLRGWNESKYATELPQEDILKHILVPLSNAYGKRIRAEKFRDSYFTLMLDALRIVATEGESADEAFQRWTGDLRRTAVKHYESVSKYIVLPPQYKGGKMNYQEIVAKVFNKETVEKVCKEGAFAHPYTCPGGSKIYLKRCHDGVWIPSGNRCPK